MKFGTINLNPEYKKYVRENINELFKQYTTVYGYKEPVFVCVGTPDVSGDAIGPYIGTVLKALDYRVYGTEIFPVTAEQISIMQKLLWIKTFLNSPIIAIDASISQNKIGSIDYQIGTGIRPGYGVGKDLGEIGNCNIKITTANSHVDLYKADINTIMGIAECVAFALHAELQKRKMNSIKSKIERGGW